VGVQDVVLGLVVERSDYGYRIVKRLEDEWSSAAVYKALIRLRDRGLIEPTAESGTKGRPRKHYRATERGVSLNAARLARMLSERDDILAQLADTPIDGLVALIDEYERRVLADIQGAPSPNGSDVMGELVAKERMFVNEARLRWIDVAREVLADGAPVV
jgi:DNA-binding PadR family transcriptional regulator